MKDYEVKWNDIQFMAKAMKVNAQAVRKAALVVERDVKTHFTLQGTYRRSGSGKKIHWSSRPGQPPAIDLGNLRASIKTDIDIGRLKVDGFVGVDKDVLKSKGSSMADYGYFLEAGAPAANIEPRPFLRPALKRQGRTINRILKAANA